MEVLEKNKINVGLLCSSTSLGFLEDLGVFISKNNGFDHEDLYGQRLSIQVATGTSSYEMRPLRSAQALRIYAAQTDCYQGSGPVYRATSTCHVAVSFMPDGRFLYSNLVLENHINKKTYFTEKEIQALLDSAEPHRLLP